MSSDETGDPIQDFTPLIHVLTEILKSAWRTRVGDRPAADMAVAHAVTKLVTERSPRAKFRMAAEQPEVLGAEAEWLLDRAADAARSRPFGNPRAVKFFEANLKLIQMVRNAEADIDSFPLLPPDQNSPDLVRARLDADRVLTATELLNRARGEHDRGDLEPARADLTEAIRLARQNDDPTTEAWAQMYLYQLEMRTSWLEPGVRDRMREHARSAEHAFRRAEHPDGIRSALVALIAVLTDLHDRPRLDRALRRLAEVNPDSAQWWRSYSDGMTADSHEECVTKLRWCRDWSHLLGDGAAHYRTMCENKIAAFEQRDLEIGDIESDLFAVAIATLRIHGAAYDEQAADRIAQVVRDLENIRLYTRSQVLQREISSTYRLAYLGAALNAEERQTAERAVDLNELASSRSLLSQIGMQTFWEKWPDHGAPLHHRSLLGRYLTNPTGHNRRQLVLGFKEARREERIREQEILAATDGPTVTFPPLRSRQVQALLDEGDDVIVYSRTGSVFLLTAAECRQIGRVDLAAIRAIAPQLRGHLADPGSSLEQRQGLVDRLSEIVVEPVHAHASGHGRLFLVPCDALWTIPSHALEDPSRVADRAVSYVPSLSILGRLLADGRLARRIERFVGIGDPDGSLTGARDEIAHAARSFTDTFTRTGSAIGYHAAVANLADADIAHIACHGFFFPDYPDFSALHVAGDRDLPLPLWYNVISRQRVNARLVVLAACFAGTGTVLYGDEYVGMPGAFLASGARCVIAPLWAVGDQSTAALMAHFYDALADSGSPGIAMRRAQRAIAANETTAHPYEWAAFQLFGVA